jgi:hypothetical protein
MCHIEAQLIIFAAANFIGFGIVVFGEGLIAAFYTATAL